MMTAALHKWLVILWAANLTVSGAHAAELTFDLRLEKGRVAQDMRIVRVKQGDAVTLRWSVDRPVTLHLHGYDIEKRVEPGKVGEMTFTAGTTGRFPVEVHTGKAGAGAHEEAPLVYVEVYPR